MNLHRKIDYEALLLEILNMGGKHIPLEINKSKTKGTYHSRHPILGPSLIILLLLSLSVRLSGDNHSNIENNKESLRE